ncbi:hypothetical protein EDC01DRAFT_627964 [Geopyxis carbonaria]|nr:hypothetical protein EDC01DRAFT_627964 [Geopyxis carbonaria]
MDGINPWGGTTIGVDSEGRELDYSIPLDARHRDFSTMRDSIIGAGYGYVTEETRRYIAAVQDAASEVQILQRREIDRLTAQSESIKAELNEMRQQAAVDRSTLVDQGRARITTLTRENEQLTTELQQRSENIHRLRRETTKYKEKIERLEDKEDFL